MTDEKDADIKATPHALYFLTKRLIKFYESNGKSLSFIQIEYFKKDAIKDYMNHTYNTTPEELRDIIEYLLKNPKEILESIPQWNSVSETKHDESEINTLKKLTHLLMSNFF